jgi:hypothetical protein
VLAVGREAVHVVSYANGAHEVAAFPREHLQMTLRVDVLWTRLVLTDRDARHQAHVWIARFMAGHKETLQLCARWKCHLAHIRDDGSRTGRSRSRPGSRLDTRRTEECA